MAKITMNEVRKGVIETLKVSAEPMTLAEIAQTLGVDKIASGSTNALIKAGVLKVAGTKKVAKVVYTEVNTYELNDREAADQLLAGEIKPAKEKGQVIEINN